MSKSALVSQPSQCPQCGSRVRDIRLPVAPLAKCSDPWHEVSQPAQQTELELTPAMYRLVEAAWAAWPYVGEKTLRINLRDAYVAATGNEAGEFTLRPPVEGQPSQPTEPTWDEFLNKVHDEVAAESFPPKPVADSQPTQNSLDSDSGNED